MLLIEFDNYFFPPYKNVIILKECFFLLNLLPFLDKTRPSSEIFTQQTNITQDRPRYFL